MMPFMASGTIVKDYTLLIAYFEEVKNLGLKPEDSYPSSRDLELVKESVLRGASRSLHDLIERLIDIFKPRVNSVAAVKAFERVYGKPTDSETAVHEVAKLLAGWTIEIAENLGMIKMKNVDYYLR